MVPDMEIALLIKIESRDDRGLRTFGSKRELKWDAMSMAFVLGRYSLDDLILDTGGAESLSDSSIDPFERGDVE